ncbi:MAG: glycoside hydrolase domain-containing protein [Cyclobacteriaceae bacterium]
MQTIINLFKKLTGVNFFNDHTAVLFLQLHVILLFISICADTRAQIAKSGAVGDQTLVSLDEKVVVWAAPAEQKVRPDDRVENSNLVWSAQEKKVMIAGAGNEHVPFQVIVTTPIPPGRRPKAPEGFFIEASDLTAQVGKVIPKSQIQLFLEHYIMLYAKSSPVGDTGYWPDALAPLKKPFNMNAQYAVVANRPVWIDVSIPSGTAAGIYKGTLRISQHGKLLETINIEMEVYNFSLPQETHLITYMNISKGWLARFYNKAASDPEIEKLTQTYYDFLYANRMEPWFNYPLEPEITVKGGKIEVKFDDTRYQYYMNKLKTKRVLLETYPSNLRRQMEGAEPFSKDFNEKVESYLSQVESYFEKHGWKDRLVFNSPIDEPNTKEDFEETRQWARLVHDATTHVPFLSTKSPLPPKNNPDWGTLRGHVDNFSIHGNSMNNPELKQAIIEEQGKGGEMTWYISCDQVYPQPNYFIDAPALDLVMVPWITERYKMDGILYWALNFWSQTPDPWLDAVTFISGFVCSDGWVLNGEGSLLYPGDRTERYTGQPDVTGPVSSIRFELLRDGIEDYEYLWMLKDAGDKEFADEQVRNLVVDVSSFSRNVEQLYITRRKMAGRLEKLAGKK